MAASRARLSIQPESIIFGFLRPETLRRPPCRLVLFNRLFLRDRIERRPEALPKHDIGIEGCSNRMKQPEHDEDRVGTPGSIVRPHHFSPPREKGLSLYAGRTADGSTVACGLFLENRDFGLFLLFPE